MNNSSDVKKAIAGLTSEEIVESDKQFNISSPKDEHETAYTKILNAYANNIDKTLENKRLFKKIVFWLAVVLLAGVFILIVGLLGFLIYKKPFDGVAEWCSVVLPAIVSFLTIFFVIPKIITEYLFNAEEEKYMSEIIKNIQNYDKEDHK